MAIEPELHRHRVAAGGGVVAGIEAELNSHTGLEGHRAWVV